MQLEQSTLPRFTLRSRILLKFTSADMNVTVVYVRIVLLQLVLGPKLSFRLSAKIGWCLGAKCTATHSYAPTLYCTLQHRSSGQ